MADPFQPTFVDLVRNTTMTAGTGNFTLGAAVMGHTSFTAACAAGDSFYYSTIAVDKPTEREVGRGTLLADGTISRDPIGGVRTNFSPGAKTIALIAAAEWYSQIQAGPSAATRAALAAAPRAQSAMSLCEPGREGLFVWKAGNQSQLVAADTAQGVVVAPASDPSGASGAWFRKYSGPLSVKWFGAAGDGASDDSAAFLGAIGWLKATATNGVGSYKASSRLFVPAGHYYLGTTTLEITHTLIIEGDATGMTGSAQATKLRWDAGNTGIRIQRFNTSGASAVDAVTHTGGDGTILRGLHLYGGFAGNEGEFHGIHAKARVCVDHCAAENFEGDGFFAETSAGSGTASEGNANISQIIGGSFRSNRNGIYVSGSDTNICSIIGVDASLNRRWGIFDKSFLGNSYFGCHAESNGIIPGSTPCIVSHAGNRYCVKKDQGAAASTNAPSGTTADNSWWYYMGAGGSSVGLNIPTWSSGGSYRDGGSYRSDGGGNANNFWSGCYIEGGQGYAQIDGPALVCGGSMRPNVRGVPVFYAVGNGVVSTGNVYGLNLSFSGTDHTIGSDTATDPVVNLRTGGTQSGFYCWRNSALDGYFINILGTYYVNGTNGVRLRAGGADIAVAHSGGLAVTGAVAASGAIGYGAGAGGAVTQTTSKSTGVTLNKLCGQITTNAAALAPGAAVSFTVTNNQVAATDAVSLVLASGNAAAGTYNYQIDKVSAGSFAISIKNISAGALSEALLFNFSISKAVIA